MGEQHKRYKETEEKVLRVYFSRPYAGIDEGKLDIVKKIIIQYVGENEGKQAAFFRQMLLSFKEKEIEMSKQQTEMSNILKADEVRSTSDIEEEGAFEEIIALAREQDIYCYLEARLGSKWLQSKNERFPIRLLDELLKESLAKGKWLLSAISAKKGWPTCERLETDVRDFGKMIHYYERAGALIRAVSRGIAIYLRFIQRKERAVAFAMGQHGRVGSESSAKEMPVEVVRGVIGF